AGAAGGLDAGRPAPVEPLQRVVHPPPRPPGVLVDRDVHALGDGEVRVRAARLGERLPDEPDLLGEPRGGRGPRAEEAVALPHGPAQRDRPVPAEPQWRARGAARRWGAPRGRAAARRPPRPEPAARRERPRPPPAPPPARRRAGRRSRPDRAARRPLPPP